MENTQLDFLIFLSISMLLFLLIAVVLWRPLMNLFLFVFVAKRETFEGQIVEIWAEKEFNFLPKLKLPWLDLKKSCGLEPPDEMDYYLRIRNKEKEEIFEISHLSFDLLKDFEKQNLNSSLLLTYKKYSWACKIEILNIFVPA